MIHLLEVTTDRGVPFRIVAEYKATFGERQWHATFYDRRHAFTEHGQRTPGTYYLDTLLERPEGGLRLDGNSLDWSLDAAAMDVVRAWLRNVAKHAFPG